MIKIDPISCWTEPKAITEWGEACNPPIAPAWLDYINFQLHPDDLTIFYRIIFPEFVVLDDITLLHIKAIEYSDEEILSFFEQSSSIEAFEKDFNNFRIYELFPHAEVLYEKSFDDVAKLLKRSWEMTLSVTFPNKKFEVVMSNTDRDYGPTLSFFQDRHRAS